MDVSQINWAVVALAVSAVLLLAWTVVARRARAGAPAAFVGLAHLVVAGLHSAAPVRGYLDPGYVGYGFGLLAAESGLAVTVTSGVVWLVAVLGGFLPCRRRGRPWPLSLSAAPPSRSSLARRWRRT